MSEVKQMFDKEDVAYLQERQLEIENRIRNLMWTVSGDYALDVKVDIEAFLQSKYIALYDSIKQGAFARYFDKEELGMYMVKKIFLNAQEAALVSISQICIEAAICERLLAERKGVENIRMQALEDTLELEFEHLSHSSLGRVRIALLKEAIMGEYKTDRMTRSYLDRIYQLRGCSTTKEIIEVIDYLYNSLIDPYFEKKRGGLDEVLKVSVEELLEFGWQDYLTEEMYADTLETYLEHITDQMTETHTTTEEERKKQQQKYQKKVVIADEEDLKKVYSYVELHYGKTYLSPVEEKRMNFRYCKGAHADCSLYFTEGILKNPVKTNYQLKYAERHQSKNLYEYHDKFRIVKQNIQELTDMLKKSLVLRDEVQEVLSDRGKVVPSRLWRVGRTADTKLFSKEIKNTSQNLVVDILIDGSGSQQSRQGQVAIQAYILSESLSNVNIPHRVMSFCTFWNYTILHKFRTYDDPRSENRNIFDYTASSNNRDGLAIQAVSDALLDREEENKILIILSDGRPYDVILNRPKARNPRPYEGKYAADDTSFEVRKLRNLGVAVLGVFAGEEKDLATEKKIFGKDFAYIRSIQNFSRVVGKYLVRQWDES